MKMEDIKSLEQEKETIIILLNKVIDRNKHTLRLLEEEELLTKSNNGEKIILEDIIREIEEKQEEIFFLKNSINIIEKQYNVIINDLKMKELL